ncbi:AI-2E family transporter [Priestia filamentosa]|uniref:AI-2E family transporter n=1 Tax=Priestia filamentosa TaxID=1402861 RepID=UPI003981DF89
MLKYLKENWRYLLNFALFLIVLIGFFFILKLSFVYAAPIYFALFFYGLYRPFIKQLVKRGVSYKVATSISVTAVSLVIVGLLISIGILLFIEGQSISRSFPDWMIWAKDSIEGMFDLLKGKMDQVPHSVVDNLKDYLETFTEKMSSWIYGILTALFSNVGSISKFLLEALIGYILSIFLAFDWPRISGFVSKYVPNNIKIFSASVFGDTLRGLATYIKAQAILISCTFIIVWISLIILGVENSLFIAFISAIFDVLPLLGVSTVFMPWIIYLFAVGQTALAIKLTILWLIIVGFRHVMEPKITGDSLGISPFIMLSGMAVSSLLFGVVEIILAPVSLVIVKSLWEKGYFNVWLRADVK